MSIKIQTPITEEKSISLHAGDSVLLSGTIYVARDAAHKRMIEALDEGKELPIDMKDATIYYMGPSPAREGQVIGSAGPTTASRMDKYAPRLLDLGEKAMTAHIHTVSIIVYGFGNTAKAVTFFKKGDFYVCSPL